MENSSGSSSLSVNATGDLLLLANLSGSRAADLEWWECVDSPRTRGPCFARILGGSLGAMYIVLVPVLVLLALARRHQARLVRLFPWVTGDSSLASNRLGLLHSLGRRPYLGGGRDDEAEGAGGGESACTSGAAAATRGDGEGCDDRRRSKPARSKAAEVPSAVDEPIDLGELTTDTEVTARDAASFMSDRSGYVTSAFPSSDDEHPHEGSSRQRPLARKREFSISPITGRTVIDHRPGV